MMQTTDMRKKQFQWYNPRGIKEIKKASIATSQYATLLNIKLI